MYDDCCASEGGSLLRNEREALLSRYNREESQLSLSRDRFKGQLVRAEACATAPVRSPVAAVL